MEGVAMPRQRLRQPGSPGHPARLALATLLAALAPLTHATEAKETPRMNASTAHVTAEQAMRGMLELIRTTPSVAELTPEAMGERLGLPIKRLSTDHFGYAQPLSGGWAFSVERQQVGAVGPRVDLIFSPVGEDRPAATPICTPDFGHFTQELERMGFNARARTVSTVAGPTMPSTALASMSRSIPWSPRARMPRRPVCTWSLCARGGGHATECESRSGPRGVRERTGCHPRPTEEPDRYDQ